MEQVNKIIPISPKTLMKYYYRKKQLAPTWFYTNLQCPRTTCRVLHNVFLGIALNTFFNIRVEDRGVKYIIQFFNPFKASLFLYRSRSTDLK